MNGSGDGWIRVVESLRLVGLPCEIWKVLKGGWLMIWRDTMGKFPLDFHTTGLVIHMAIYTRKGQIYFSADGGLILLVYS